MKLFKVIMALFAIGIFLLSCKVCSSHYIVFEDYMTVAQIKELMADPLVTIGGHSHTHNRLGSYTKLVERIKNIKDDTELMVEWFNDNLGFTPTKFCFPYNDDYQGIYQSLLKIYGFTEFYGRERTPVETLLRIESL